MRKRRPNLQVEQLEARETPDVSLAHAGASSVQPPQQPQASLASPLPAVEQSPRANQIVATTDAELASGLALLAAADNAVFHPQALESLFYSSDQGDQILTDSHASASAEIGIVGHVADLQAPPRQDSTSLVAGEDRGTFVVTHDPAVTQLDTRQGWKFLSNYTLKAIRNDELRYGRLNDSEDILQQVFVEWRQEVGNREGSFTNLLNRDSAERLVLRKTVRRVIDRARYEQGKQQRMLPLFDQAAPAQPVQQDWVDLQIDWSHGASRLDPRDRHLLELRRQGKTFEEIGTDLGMAKQRVFEIYSDTIDRLQSLYSA